MSDWFYQASGGKVMGPVNSTQLKDLAGASIIKPSTLIRQGTSGQWVAASQANGLFPSSPQVAPPVPQPSSKPSRTEVVIKGVDIPVMELATLQFKMAIAAIPALMMLFCVVGIPTLIIVSVMFARP